MSTQTHRVNLNLNEMLASAVAHSMVLFCSILLLSESAIAKAQETSQKQSPIVLRDLSLIRDAEVESFDSTGVTLSNKTRLGWDKILRATVASDRQSEFDRNIKLLGLPVFRLKTRIANSDWQGAAEIAAPIFENEDGWNSLSPDLLYLASLTMMKSQLQKGIRDQAIWSFVVAAEKQSEASEEALKLAGTNRLTQRECQLGVAKSILPVWFNPSINKKTVERLEAYLESKTDAGEKPSPGEIIYLSSMLIELESYDAAKRWLGELDGRMATGEKEIRAWQNVLRARIKLKNGELDAARISLEELVSNQISQNEIEIETPRMVALYYAGLTEMAGENVTDSQRAKATLTFLTIPAVYGDTHKSLSAAALFQSAEIAKLRGRDGDAQKLRTQLLRKYPRTYHGSLKMSGNN